MEGRFRHCREAVPLLGEEVGKDRTQCRHFFSLLAVSQPWRPSQSRYRSTAPPKGEPRAKYKSTQPAKTSTVIQRRAKPDVGIRFSLTPQLVFGLS